MEKLVPGLEGVPIMESEIGFINGLEGILEYRGISLRSWLRRVPMRRWRICSCLGNCPLVMNSRTFDQDLRTHRRVKYRILDMMKCMPENGHPMDMLQAAVAAMGMFYPARDIRDETQRYWSTIRLIAKMPTIVAAFERMRHGDEPVRPRDDCLMPRIFCGCLNEEEPDPLDARIMDVCLILHAEHTMNASTFSGLVVGSTEADPVYHGVVGHWRSDRPSPRWSQRTGAQDVPGDRNGGQCQAVYRSASGGQTKNHGHGPPGLQGERPTSERPAKVWPSSCLKPKVSIHCTRLPKRLRRSSASGSGQKGSPRTSIFTPVWSMTSWTSPLISSHRSLPLPG